MNLLRKETIGKYIQDKGAVTVKELGALFPEVSLMTIHRDVYKRQDPSTGGENNHCSRNST